MIGEYRYVKKVGSVLKVYEILNSLVLGKNRSNM